MVDHISRSRPPTINPEPQLKGDHSAGLFVKDVSFFTELSVKKKLLLVGKIRRL